jgi:hypothetical protein
VSKFSLQVPSKKKPKRAIRPRTAIAIAAGAALAVIGLYFYQFGHLPRSTSQSVWGAFGDYLGGVVGVVFGFVTVLILILDRERARRDSVRAARAAREQSRIQLGMRASSEVLKIVELYQSHIDKLMDRECPVEERTAKSIRDCCADARRASLLAMRWARLIEGLERGVFERIFVLIESQIDVASELHPHSRRRVGSYIDAANREFLHMIHRLHVESHQIITPDQARYERVIATLENWKGGDRSADAIAP